MLSLQRATKDEFYKVAEVITSLSISSNHSLHVLTQCFGVVTNSISEDNLNRLYVFDGLVWLTRYEIVFTER